MGDDFRVNLKKTLRHKHILNEKIKQAVLNDIDTRLIHQNSSINNFFGKKNCALAKIVHTSNRLILEETSYSRDLMQKENDNITLTRDQKYI